ncbi:uncharacterized protein K452DRAFT_264768 [Aplosporella prunicola CBS 121167]|uniref:Mediator of RNA polymerase II transcription subunit 16 n=1 Tax=Aplosporella prunicola CBS 121167 TaxID=1176127 RepID=A0A6A6BPG2_9PEZI|nr:uncharacterized protein K452DRAFT_264768 [Aplosporella prunicola CBS 121167]KAF2145598.1 hypothetical protein K452DRAFT_264768 [Aplosporella prunicola CBS 121167]
MPLIMDDDQYMEDLFNESGPIPISVAPSPLRGLSQRLNELQESGCCQSISWSRSGCIASITRDGHGVNLRAFQRNPSDGKWALGDEVPLPIHTVHDEFPIVHVSWGHLGVDLAVIDAAGRILIFTAEPALDRMRLSRDNFTDQETETGAIVGLHWLPVYPQQHRYHMLWSADRDEGKWQYRMTSHQWKEPHNPIEGGSKAAFLCLTRGGTIRLLFQAEGNHWLDATAELEASNSAKDAFTHASFASDQENSLLLVAHSESGTLHVFRVKINWNIPPNRQRIDPPPTPILEVTALKSEENCLPLSTGFDAGGGSLEPNHRLSQPAQLTHLMFVPTGPEPGPHTGISHPTVMAVFCHTPAAATSLMDQAQQSQQPFSILARWELRETRNSLHPAFEQLTAKKRSSNTGGQRQSLEFQRQPDIVMNSVTLGIWSLDFHTKFAIFQSNGTTEFRDRYTMERMVADFNEEKVSSLIQAGFDFSKHEPALHLALSPSACIAALVQHDGTITLKNMEYGLGPLTSKENDPKISAAMSALVLQYSSASLQYSSTDDLFAIMPPDIDLDLARAFLIGTHYSTNVTADYTAEELPQKTLQQIFSNSLLRGSLSAQNLIGTGTDGKRNLSAKLAWIALNLRLTSWNLAMAVRTKPEALSQEAAKAITGPVKWTTDVMVYILDELIELSKRCKGHEGDREFIQQKLQEMNSPAIFLLLCSYPRALFRVSRGPLQALLSASQMQVRFAPTVLHRATFNALLATVINSPVQPPPMAFMVQETDQAVRKVYAATQLSIEQRKAIEREMLIKAEIPGLLMPVVTGLLTTVVDKVLDMVNPANVMFHDLRWLCLHEDGRSIRWAQENTVDVLRKAVLSEKEGKRRRCTRCGNIMEDLDSWLGMPQNKCACAGAWSQMTRKV